MLHPSIIPEITLIHAYAEDKILRNTLKGALTSGGPEGTPGKLDISCVGTAQLDQVCLLAVETSVKTQAAAMLLNACRNVRSLREAILRTQDANDDTVRAYMLISRH